MEERKKERKKNFKDRMNEKMKERKKCIKILNTKREKGRSKDAKERIH